MDDKGDKQVDKKSGWIGLFWFIVAVIVANVVVASFLTNNKEATSVPYSEFRRQVDADNVETFASRGDAITGTFRTKVAYPAGEKSTIERFSTRRPSFATDSVVSTLISNGVEVKAERESSGISFFLLMLLNFGPALLIILGYLWLMRRTTSAFGGIGTFGKSRAVRADEGRQSVTFADVAGIDEAKDELIEVVDFLRSPKRYRELGARAPRGVLLMGAPGTGKTLLAKAVAGEARVPFFSMSGSEFIEMIVGVGASRVRDLFAQAKAVAPSIVFIDELDAIGRTRGFSTSFGGADEREQTLNQILTEMDGFAPNQEVIVLAATNRPDILDSALLRPGRFDRRVMINAPDQAGRLAILRVHTRAVPLAGDVDLDEIASTTPGMVGADLANLVNEAALTAARCNEHAVTSDDFSEALERILIGAERKILLTEDDRRRTAYHEAGHALMGMLQEGADPVRKVSIIPHGRALGVTLQSPETDRYGMGETYLRGRIVGALGGRAAEELVLGELTTGAEDDLEEATLIARSMVGRWGMSKTLGPVSVIPDPEDELEGYVATVSPLSEATRQLIDIEVRSIVDDCHQRALSILVENRDRLDNLVRVLLERETLDEDDAYAAAGTLVTAPSTDGSQSSPTDSVTGSSGCRRTAAS